MMSTILFEPITQAPSQPHSLTVVGGNQIHNLAGHFKQALFVSQPSLNKCPTMQPSSLQTPPPTPRRHEGDRDLALHPPLARNYPRHLSFPIPRRFSSPQFQGRCMNMEDKLTEYSADFAGVPVDYVRQTLRKRGKKLYDTVRTSTFQWNGSRVSAKKPELDSDAMPATHVLVVYPLNPSSTSVPEFHPVHSLVPTVYCANLPSFPKSDDPSTSSTLPHLPIRLPHPPSFKLILHFLYTRNIQNILSYLLPAPWPSREHHDYISHPTLHLPISLSVLAGFCRSTFAALSPEDRYLHLDLLYGVYSNVVALGMYDLPLHGTRDEDEDPQNPRKDLDDQPVTQRGVERLNSDWESIVIQNGSRDVDGRLLCACLMAIWEGLQCARP